MAERKHRRQRNAGTTTVVVPQASTIEYQEELDDMSPTERADTIREQQEYQRKHLRFGVLRHLEEATKMLVTVRDCGLLPQDLRGWLETALVEIERVRRDL